MRIYACADGSCLEKFLRNFEFDFWDEEKVARREYYLLEQIFSRVIDFFAWLFSIKLPSIASLDACLV